MPAVQSPVSPSGAFSPEKFLGELAEQRPWRGVGPGSTGRTSPGKHRQLQHRLSALTEERTHALQSYLTAQLDQIAGRSSPPPSHYANSRAGILGDVDASAIALSSSLGAVDQGASPPRQRQQRRRRRQQLTHLQGPAGRGGRASPTDTLSSPEPILSRTLPTGFGPQSEGGSSSPSLRRMPAPRAGAIQPSKSEQQRRGGGDLGGPAVLERWCVGAAADPASPANAPGWSLPPPNTHTLLASGVRGSAC
jgi:hypothetical protein